MIAQEPERRPRPRWKVYLAVAFVIATAIVEILAEREETREHLRTLAAETVESLKAMDPFFVIKRLPGNFQRSLSEGRGWGSFLVAPIQSVTDGFRAGRSGAFPAVCFLALFGTAIAGASKDPNAPKGLWGWIFYAVFLMAVGGVVAAVARWILMFLLRSVSVALGLVGTFSMPIIFAGTGWKVSQTIRESRKTLEEEPKPAIPADRA